MCLTAFFCKNIARLRTYILGNNIKNIRGGVCMKKIILVVIISIGIVLIQQKSYAVEYYEDVVVTSCNSVYNDEITTVVSKNINIKEEVKNSEYINKKMPVYSVQPKIIDAMERDTIADNYGMSDFIADEKNYVYVSSDKKTELYVPIDQTITPVVYVSSSSDTTTRRDIEKAVSFGEMHGYDSSSVNIIENGVESVAYFQKYINGVEQVDYINQVNIVNGNIVMGIDYNYTTKKIDSVKIIDEKVVRNVVSDKYNNLGEGKLVYKYNNNVFKPMYMYEVEVDGDVKFMFVNAF